MDGLEDLERRRQSRLVLGTGQMTVRPAADLRLEKRRPCAGWSLVARVWGGAPRFPNSRYRRVLPGPIGASLRLSTCGISSNGDHAVCRSRSSSRFTIEEEVQ